MALVGRTLDAFRRLLRVALPFKHEQKSNPIVTAEEDRLDRIRNPHKYGQGRDW